MNCRHCKALLTSLAVDLGHQPPSNAYLDAADLLEPEIYVPLKVFVCDSCWLVQVATFFQANELFTPSYAYFSSISSTWVEHARRYVTQMVDRLALTSNSFVVEIASNDGYLLQFVQQSGIPCLGIEPTAATAEAARTRGIESLELFFGEAKGRELADDRRPADLIVANNVLAHVPDINDFVAGFRELLAPNGVATFEFPHVQRLVDGSQFDTIYHEHYSYLSLIAVRTIFESQGLRVFDVEELPTHGGSLRVFACRKSAAGHVETKNVSSMLEREKTAGLQTTDYYKTLQLDAERVKLDLLRFLVEERRNGRTVACYGAAAKGNTLLNYAGVKRDLVAFVCDAALSKQGRFLPGSHIAILSPAALFERTPDVVLILPWNIRGEIVDSLKAVRSWGGQFAVAVPRLETF